MHWYDENGNIKKIKNKTIEERFLYDQRDRVSQKEAILEGQVYTTQYRYDRVGNCTHLKEPLQESFQEYQYDHQHRLMAVAGYGTFGYYPNGRIEKIAYGNGLTTTYTLDGRNRPKRITTSDGILDLSYTYDGEGNVLEENEDTFSYDELNRLKTAYLKVRGEDQGKSEAMALIRESFGYYVHESLYQSQADVNKDGRIDGLDLLIVAPGFQGLGQNTTYQYAEVGNRISREENGEDTLYAYDPNTDRLLQVTHNGQMITYEYDEEGNMTKKITPQDTFTYTFDYENRLTTISSHQYGILAEYSYNTGGQRVKKVAGGKTTLYHYDKDQLIGEETQEGVTHTTKRYLYAGAMHLAQEDSQGVSYYHGDHLGSSRVVTDATKARVW